MVVLVLRPAAIYGPGRGLHTAMREGRFKLVGDGGNWVSRIHVDDLLGISSPRWDPSLQGLFPLPTRTRVPLARSQRSVPSSLSCLFPRRPPSPVWTKLGAPTGAWTEELSGAHSESRCDTPPTRAEFLLLWQRKKGPPRCRSMPLSLTPFRGCEYDEIRALRSLFHWDQ